LEFLEKHKEHIDDVIDVANDTLSVEEKWNKAKVQLFEIYKENKNYYGQRFADGKVIVLDEITGKYKYATEYLNEYRDVIDGASAVAGLVGDTLVESKDIIVENSHKMKETADQMFSSLKDKTKKKMKDFKKKDHQAIERIEQSGILKDVLISLEGVHETKEERIAKVDAWLSHSKNSISAFASCPYDKKSSFEKKYSLAAFSQYQAERCYQVYREELLSCTYSDDICLLTNHQLVEQCHGHAKIAFNLVNN